MTNQRKEVIGDATLYLGDCRDWLASVPPCLRLGALITDPPFGVGFKYASHDDRPEAYEGGYGVWLWSILERCEAHLEAGAPAFVWQAGPHIRHFGEWFPRDWRLFVAAKNFVQMRPTAMQYAYDPVVAWWKSGEKPWSAGTASRDFHVANTAPIVATPENIEKAHPCPRPADQVGHIIEQWVKPGAVILDPFLGSGTTAVAAILRGRRCVGIESDPDYFDIACRRIAKAYEQPRLFDEPTPKPVQPSLLGDAA